MLGVKGSASPPGLVGRRTRLLARGLAVAAVMALGLSSLVAAPVAAAESPVNIDVLTLNDFHGHIEADEYGPGAAAIATAVKQFRVAGNTLVVSAGDNIGASAFTSAFQQDAPTIDALNAIGLDASALGDHEFDRGRADISDRVIPAADFPYLAANLYDRQTGQPAFEQYVVKDVEGVSIGFIGAITNQLPTQVDPATIATLEVRDAVTEVNRVAADLHDGEAANGEADVLILLVHEGAATSKLAASAGNSAFGRIVTQTDSSVAAIVSGHTHQLYNHLRPVAGQTLLRPVIQAAEDGRTLGHLSLAIDPQSHELLSIASELLPLTSFDVPLYPADPAVEALVDAATAVADTVGTVKIGAIYDYISKAFHKNGENRGGESTLGNFLADAQLHALASAGAQIALMHPGGLAASFETHAGTPNVDAGDVSYRDAASVQPDSRTLVTMDLTGNQLRQVLEEQWQPKGSTWPFLKLGQSDGLFYTYDPLAPTGQHITQLYFHDVEIIDGDVYRVVANSFLAAGGDNFSTFAAGTNRVDSGRTDLQAVLAEFASDDTVSPPEKQRAIGVHYTPADSDGYERGQKISITLSSLIMTGGEDFGNDVYTEFSSGGVIIGGGVFTGLDQTIVDGTDEVGRSTIPVTIPEDAATGLNYLSVMADGAGGSFLLPILVTSGPVIVDTTTTATVRRLAVSQKRAVQLRVKVVAANGAAPSGTLEIFDRGVLITTTALQARTVGVVTTSITGLGRGVHRLTVHYSGSATLRASGSQLIPVVVY